MITYDKLNQKPRAFRSITAMGIAEFDELFRKSIPLWTRLERERLSRSDRKRAIGGSHPYAFQLRERLLMTAIWLRPYLSNEALGFFFGVDKSAASRNTRHVLPCLRQLEDETLGRPELPKRGEGKSIEQALRDYPDLLAIIDTTEQPVERPGDDEQQKAHYSRKKKRHTHKTQITVNEKGIIRDVSASTPGSMLA
jgi:hypothetical protein